MHKKKLIICSLVVGIIFMVLSGVIFSEDTQLSQPTSSSPRPISSPGSGANPGNLLGSSDTILFTGSFTHNISLEVPPGDHGFQPKLNLVYNSSINNGWCGVGWDLSVGIIQRSTKNGMPKYDDSDIFIISFGGMTQELVPIGNNEYRTKIESSFMRFKYDGYWTVWDKSGTKYFFGYTPDVFNSIVVNYINSKTYSWSLSKIVDTNNNEIHYKYIQDQYQIYPESIEYIYNGIMPLRKIIFTLEDRSDIITNYRVGFCSKTAKRLKSIETKINDESIKKYDLVYINHPNTTHSLLTMVETTGRDNIQFPYGILLSYQMNETPGLNYSGPLLSCGTEKGFYFCDLNNDGKVDVANNIDSNRGIDVWYSNGNGFEPSVRWLESSVSGNFHFADFNGDGLMDICCKKYTGTYTYDIELYMNKGNDVIISSGTWATITDSLNLGFALGDFNGDGKIDISHPPDPFIKPKGPQMFITKTTNDGFTTPEVWNLYDYDVYGGNSYYYADFNGDGKTDIARNSQEFIVNGKYDYHGFAVWISTGTGFEYNGEWIGKSERTYYPYIYDFNGDGLVDVAFKGENLDGIYVWLSTGNNLIYSGEWAIFSHDYLNDRKIYFRDFNGDNLTDLAVNNEQYGGLDIWFNTGSNFKYHGLWTEAGTGSRKFQLYDFNGDGKCDVSRYHSEIDTGAAGLDVWVNKGKIPNLLSSMTNILQGRTDIFYESSTNFSNSYLPFSINLVSKLIANDSYRDITKLFTYKDGYYNHLTKDFLGFGEVKETDAAGNYTITKFYQDEIYDSTSVFPYKGKIKEQAQYDINSSLLAKTVNTYGCVKPVADKDWYFPHLTQTDNYTNNGNIEKHTWAKYFYDQYGNVNEVDNLGDYSTNTDDVIHLTEYAYNTDNYLVGYSIHQITRDYNLLNKAESWLYYDGAVTKNTAPVKGNVTAVEKWLDTGGSNPIVRTYYDDYGNVIKTEDANYNADNTKGNVITTVYDSVYHTFPVTVTNILGHISFATYDPGTGNVLTETDPNGQTTRYIYDSFGRITETYGPMDNNDAPSVRYTYGDGMIPPTVTLETKQQGGAVNDDKAINYLLTYQYFDGFGRLAQTQSQNNTTWSKYVISDVKTYNNRGLVDKTYTSFFPDQKTYKYWWFGKYYGNPADLRYCSTTLYTYDALGRVIRQDFSDGTYSTVSFSGWTETRTNGISATSTGQVINYEKDAFGRIIQVTEHNNGQDYLTKYTYDTLGNLKTITNALSETTTINYDSLGRKTSMDDPKMGLWSYTYDANGNLAWQKDGKGQEITLNYDRLSRISSKVYPLNSGQISYTYDTCSTVNYGLGRLSKVTDLSGFTEFTYDQLGQVTSTKKNITIGNHPKDYTTGSTYNALGQQTKLSYPNNEEITYTYFTCGNLLSLGDNATDFVKAIGYNQNKQILGINFNNELTTAYVYNKDNLRLTKLITGKTSDFHFTDPTYISYDRKDHTAFREFLNKLKEVSK